jgi:hypothetical protein
MVQGDKKFSMDRIHPNYIITGSVGFTGGGAKGATAPGIHIERGTHTSSSQLVFFSQSFIMVVANQGGLHDDICPGPSQT